MKGRAAAKACMAILLTMTSVLSGCGADATAQISPQKDIVIEEELPAAKPAPEDTQKDEASDTVKKDETKKPDTEKKDKDMEKTKNSFNWDYYDTLDTDSNIFYSPFSLQSALGMALAGAKGDTYDEMASALCIEDIDTFMDGYKKLSSGYSGEKTRLTAANSLWIDKTFEKDPGIDPAFVSKLEEKMDAEVIPADFKNDPNGASKEISAWVQDKTENLIPDYRSVSTGETVLDIINAIYFFGEWKYKFEADNTYDESFRNKNGASDVKMMHMSHTHFRYYDDGNFKGIELPYFDDNAVMDIIMTSDDDDTDSPAAFKNLSAKEKDDIISGISSAETSDIFTLSLPKFTMDITAEGLKEALSSMGMKAAFDKESADFSGISRDLYISDIAHRAKIEVDEEGSRAAAVTEVVMNVTGALIPDSDPIEFICDRPFVFVIRDSRTDTILFTGAVNEPQ